jgi:hypothetical protein
MSIVYVLFYIKKHEPKISCERFDKTRNTDKLGSCIDTSANFRDPVLHKNLSISSHECLKLTVEN